MGRLLVAVRAWAPVIAVSLGLVFLGIAAIAFVQSSAFGYDYLAYDAAARRIAAGGPVFVPGSAEAYAAGRYDGLYLYPPVVAVAFLPLTLLDQSPATVVWLVLRIAALVGACLVLPVASWVRASVLAVACVSFPVLFDLNLGNVSVVVFAACAVGWRWVGSPAAAVAHAVLVALRFPFALFGLTWLLQGRFRSLAWTVIAVAALIVVSLPVVGISSYSDYVAILRALPDLSGGSHNLSLRTAALAVGLPDGAAGVIQALGYVLGLAAVAYAARRRDASSAFVVTALATMLVSPFLHPHYLVLLLLPAALLADRGRWWGLGLPLLGWLPDAFLPVLAPFAMGLVLATPERDRVPE